MSQCFCWLEHRSNVFLIIRTFLQLILPQSYVVDITLLSNYSLYIPGRHQATNIQTRIQTV